MNIRHALVASLLLVTMVATASAQSVTNPTQIEFTPASAPALDVRTGTPMVEKFTLDVYRAGTTTLVQTVNLGKPAPEPDGTIRVNLASLFATPLATGVVYEAVVSAVGPFETAPSARSETFAFSTACTPAISPTSSTLSTWLATNASVAVTADATCGWTAASNAAWITITANAHGTGSATVSYAVAANQDTTSRTGTITIGGQTFTVTQPGVPPCTFNISPTTANFSSASAATGTVAVTTAAGCAWTATSNDSWITISAGAAGTGNGTVSYTVAANTGSASRTGTLRIAGSTFTITQAGAPCAFTLSPLLASLASSDATTATVTVNSGAGCGWTATSSATWITITSGASGNGTGTVNYSVAQNTGTTSRVGSMTIAGKSFAVIQPATTACAFTISPTSQAFDPGGGSGTVTVTTTSGCNWTASSLIPWVTISGGATGTGSGTVTFAVAPNTGSLSRSATLTIAGKSFTVTQATATCTFAVSPSLITSPPTGSSGSIAVTTQPTCAWTATTTSAWVTVTGSGVGSGTATYTVQPNTGTIGRSGLVKIGGVFVGVSQAAPTAAPAPVQNH